MTGDDVTDVRQVFDDLVRFETMLWSAIDERLQRDCDLSLGSLNTMLVIEATPACRVFDIARALAITVGGASQAVDRLERVGWCVRKANPADRRSSIVELTSAGAALVGSAGPVFDEELERLLSVPLSEPALTRLAGTLGILRRSADAHTSTIADAAKKTGSK